MHASTLCHVTAKSTMKLAWHKIDPPQDVAGDAPILALAAVGTYNHTTTESRS